MDDQTTKEILTAARTVVDDHRSDASWKERDPGVRALARLVALQEAHEIGTEHGRSAAGWWQQDAIGGRAGGDTRARAVSVLRMMAEGDPALWDDLPRADLSGQWGDGYGVDQLCEDTGAPDSGPDDLVVIADELADAYDEAFITAVAHEVERVCRAELACESESAARQAWIDHVPVHCGECFGRITCLPTAGWVHAEDGPTMHDAYPLVGEIG